MDESPFGPDRLADAPLIRRAVPIRVSFLHTPVKGGGSGPLAEFVSERRGLALDLFLLALASEPAIAGNPIRRASREWGYALGMSDPAAARAAVSRSWSWLEAHALVRSERLGRARAIELLREDGSGLPYVHPADADEPYFRLPHAYWESNWHQSLRLAGKAVLLIALSLQSDREKFELPVSRGADWYGLSAGTVARGLRELRAVGLLWMFSAKRSTDASPVGYAYDREYQLRDLAVVGRQLRRADGTPLQ